MNQSKSAILRRAMLWIGIGLFSLVSFQRSAYGGPANWPSSIQGESGFADLGQALAREPGFPRSGSDVDKARFIFAHLPAIVKKYGLKPGTGSKLSDGVIGFYRKFFSDPESAESLKGCTGWGNCGEFSYAFSEMLGGAGVTCRVVYGDSQGAPRPSERFTGTDTTVIVVERTPTGKVSRRVFDAFRALYHAPGYVPDRESLERWGDVPLMERDKLPRDKKRLSWLANVEKQYVKEAVSHLQLPSDPPRAWPRDPASPTFNAWRECENGGQEICGTWTFNKGSSRFSARWDNGAAAMLKLERFDDRQVVVTRHDAGGASTGLSARYVGTRDGNSARGTVTWSWKGRTWSGTWSASW